MKNQSAYYEDLTQGHTLYWVIPTSAPNTTLTQFLYFKWSPDKLEWVVKAVLTTHITGLEWDGLGDWFFALKHM